MTKKRYSVAFDESTEAWLEVETEARGVTIPKLITQLVEERALPDLFPIRQAMGVQEIREHMDTQATEALTEMYSVSTAGRQLGIDES